MANTSSITFFFFFFFLYLLIQTSSAGSFNVISFGAKGDGKTDSTKSFLKAWTSACSSSTPSTINVPKGRFLLTPITFRGPCNNHITFRLNGTLVAPLDYRALGNSGYWILFIKVDGVSFFGGNIDAKGAGYWACKKAGKQCPVGARSLTFNWANNIYVSGITSINSQQTHLVINSCKNVMVKNVKVMAPDQSPNTDGIHVQSSFNVTITGSTLQTGDDCISIGDGTKSLLMSHVKCGPGHGVSIGSLGKEFNEDGVENVTLTNAIFIGSDNGVRIKTWPTASNGFVKNVLFQNIIMKNVKNPILIDQNYCPNNKGCPSQSSGVKISGVTYRNIQGTSATIEAMTFDCSPSNPCSDIQLQDIKLTYKNKTTTSSCKNIGGSSIGVLVPESCL
ncbi:polygalacturonase-like [Benincasa hispida]|uniref:polygalacturonase-like n=1 Tax=Benincasa hispida TaxID=102211 RepID=UPI0019024FC8|nr:polygalacturonase-like [Benincasa hispida]XP_038888876.1 polygalacturonase-like [Benincasa hispida]